MSIVVTQPTDQDLARIADLLLEMDDFYKEPKPESAATKIANMHEVLFGGQPSAYMLMALDDGGASVLGVACYSFLWPASGTTRSLYLKELYVRQSRRRDGIGRLLMDRLFAVARDNRCSRIEWTTDRANLEAQRFYGSLGVPVNADKLFYRAEV